MVRRTAGILALLAFAVCLVAGLNAGNSTVTVLSNALLAMAGTFVIGLAVGAMAQKMLEENAAAEAEPSPDGAAAPARVEEK